MRRETGMAGTADRLADLRICIWQSVVKQHAQHGSRQSRSARTLDLRVRHEHRCLLVAQVSFGKVSTRIDDTGLQLGHGGRNIIDGSRIELETDGLQSRSTIVSR